MKKLKIGWQIKVSWLVGWWVGGREGGTEESREKGEVKTVVREGKGSQGEERK